MAWFAMRPVVSTQPVHHGSRQFPSVRCTAQRTPPRGRSGGFHGIVLVRSSDARARAPKIFRYFTPNTHRLTYTITDRIAAALPLFHSPFIHRIVSSAGWTVEFNAFILKEKYEKKKKNKTKTKTNVSSHIHTF
jgi:hypothetical protein